MRKFVTASAAAFLAGVFATSAIAVAAPASAGMSPERRAVVLAERAEHNRTQAVPTGDPRKWATAQFLALINSQLPAADNNKVQLRAAFLSCSKPFFSKKLQLTAAQLSTHPVGVFGMEYIKQMRAELNSMLALPAFKAASAAQKREWIVQSAREWMMRLRSGMTLVACSSNWDPSVKADGSGTLLGFKDASLLVHTKVNWRNPLVQSQLAAQAITINFAPGYMPEMSHLSSLESQIRLTGTYDKSFLQPTANSGLPNALAAWGRGVTIK